MHRRQVRAHARCMRMRQGGGDGRVLRAYRSALVCCGPGHPELLYDVATKQTETFQIWPKLPAQPRTFTKQAHF